MSPPEYSEYREEDEAQGAPPDDIPEADADDWGESLVESDPDTPPVAVRDGTDADGNAAYVPADQSTAIAADIEADDASGELPGEREERPSPEIADAAELAERLPIDHVDFRDFDPRLAKEVTDTLSGLTTKYPEIDTIKWVSTTQARDKALADRGVDCEPLPSDVYAVAATGEAFGEQGGISVNEPWARDYDRFHDRVKADVEEGYHPPGTDSPSAVLTHEFGHMIDFYLEDAGMREEFLGPVLDEMTGQGYEWVSENISEYAASQSDRDTLEREIVAECFAEYNHSSNPRPAAKSIGGAMDAAFAKLRSR